MRSIQFVFFLSLTILVVPPSAARFHASDVQLKRLIDTLLEENPQLRSVMARTASLRTRVDQVGSLPDPQLNYRYFAQTPETRVGPQEHMLEISQGIPWRGKRRLQAQGAEHLASGLSWEAEDLEQRLVAGLKRNYYEAAYLQEALTVNREEQELLERFEAIALKRYSTGKGIQQNVVKVQTEISRLVDREVELEKKLAVVERGIAAMIGRPETALALDPIELAVPALEYDRASLEQRSLDRHPQVLAVEDRIEADRSLVQRRSLDSKPDFRFGVGYTLVGRRDDPAAALNPPPDDGQDVLALSVGLNIPIQRKRIRAGVEEVRESERANEELLTAVRDRLRFDIQQAVLQLNSLDERGRLYLEVIIPQARESLASAETAYTTDRLGFLDLLDAERVLFQSRLAYHRLAADLWIAMAELEQSAAQPFPAQDEGHE